MARPVIWENEERIPSPSEKLIQKSKEMPYVPIGKFVNKCCVKCSAIAIAICLTKLVPRPTKQPGNEAAV